MLNHLEIMEKSNHIATDSPTFNDLSRCPICFKSFSRACIESHASSCIGVNDNIQNSDIKTKNTIPIINDTMKNNDGNKKHIASIFKTSSERKRPVANIDELSSENKCKTIKTDTKYKEYEPNMSVISKASSKNVRQPLADIMRPSALEQYKGQE